MIFSIIKPFNLYVLAQQINEDNIIDICLLFDEQANKE